MPIIITPSSAVSPAVNSFTDELINTSAIIVGSYVKIVNNASNVGYISSAATGATGLFTISAPSGTYTVYTGPTSAGPWTATGNANYIVSNTVPVFNVMDYGAKGDGSTDDTVAIQLAITTAASGRGGTVLVPTGNYRISSALTIPNSQTLAIRLIGEGKGSTTIYQATASTDIIQVGTVSRFDVSDLTLALTGVATGHCISGGVTSTQGWEYGTVSRVRLLNADSTHWAIRLINPFSLKIQDVEISNCGNGIYFIEDSATVNYGNCRLDHIEVLLPAAGSGTGLKFESLTAKIMNLNTVTRFDVFGGTYGTGSTGVHLAGAAHNYFYGCNFDGCDSGIKLTSSSANSINNHFHGIYIRASGETSGAINVDANSRGNYFHNILLNVVVGASNNTCISDLCASATQPNSYSYVQSADTWTTNVSVQTVTRFYGVLLGNVLQPNVSTNTWSDVTFKNFGAGTNPQLAANSGGQNLDLIGLSLRPRTDGSPTLGDTTHRWSNILSLGYRIIASSGDARGTTEISAAQIQFGVGGATVPDRTLSRDGSGFSFVGGRVLLDSNLVMSTAASKLIPGATSFAIRNNADGANNVLVSNAGAVTVLDTLTAGTATSGASLITAVSGNVLNLNGNAAGLNDSAKINMNGRSIIGYDGALTKTSISGTKTVIINPTAYISPGFEIAMPATGTVTAELIGMQQTAQTITITGGYATQRFAVLAQPTITAGSALTVTTAATLAVANAPAATGSAVITNAYSIWNQAGIMRVDGTLDVNNGIALGGGAAPTFGTIGGTGPATAAQNSWLKVKINGTDSYIAIWR